jgi:hypothetical protein
LWLATDGLAADQLINFARVVDGRWNKSNEQTRIFDTVAYRVGESVKCSPPKGAAPGTASACGEIIDYAVTDPAWTDDWGWYFYIVEIIRWENGEVTARYAYWSFPPHGKKTGNRKGWKWGQYGPEDRLPVMLSLAEKAQELIRKHMSPNASAGERHEL